MDEMLRLYKERARLLRWEPTSYRELFLAENKRKILELRSNENHDPTNGRFTSGPGGSSGKGLTEGGKSGKIKSSEKPEWSGKEAKEPFNYWELSEDKTGFPTNWKPTEFANDEFKKDHVGRHRSSVNAATDEEYIAKARAFLTSPRGKHGDAFVTKQGDVYRYDYDTHEFAVARKNGTIRTYWNLLQTKTPDAADKYWEGQKP